MITITTMIISPRAVVEYIFDIRNLSPPKAMTIIINSPSTDVTELTSETLQAEGYEIDMEECWKIYNMLGIQIFPSELYSISAFKPYFKDKIFFDIGASVGSWSASALMYGAKEVYAFDPLPDDRVSATDNYNLGY